MTRNEAIDRIREHMAIHKLNEPRAAKITEALNMAIEALKEQQPRLYERAELYLFESTESIVWLEPVGTGIIPGLITNIKEPYYANILVVNGGKTDEIILTMDYYGRYWRCWTARPTDEQRKAEPWKDGGQE